MLLRQFLIQEIDAVEETLDPKDMGISNFDIIVRDVRTAFMKSADERLQKLVETDPLFTGKGDVFDKISTSLADNLVSLVRNAIKDPIRESIMRQIAV